MTRSPSEVSQTLNTLKGFFLSRIHLDAVNSQNKMFLQILHGCLNLKLPGCELGHACYLTGFAFAGSKSLVVFLL